MQSNYWNQKDQQVGKRTRTVWNKPYENDRRPKRKVRKLICRGRGKDNVKVQPERVYKIEKKTIRKKSNYNKLVEISPSTLMAAMMENFQKSLQSYNRYYNAKVHNDEDLKKTMDTTKRLINYRLKEKQCPELVCNTLNQIRIYRNIWQHLGTGAELWHNQVEQLHRVQNDCIFVLERLNWKDLRHKMIKRRKFLEQLLRMRRQKRPKPETWSELNTETGLKRQRNNYPLQFKLVKKRQIEEMVAKGKKKKEIAINIGIKHSTWRHWPSVKQLIQRLEVEDHDGETIKKKICGIQLKKK